MRARAASGPLHLLLPWPGTKTTSSARPSLATTPVSMALTLFFFMAPVTTWHQTFICLFVESFAFLLNESFSGQEFVSFLYTDGPPSV